MDSWADIVQRCCEHLDALHRSEWGRIKVNLEMGGIVAVVMSTADYGDKAVERLAHEISRKRGRTVYPQRLYEAYRVYSTVRSIEKAKEIASCIEDELTWNWLVRYATRGYKKESDKNVKKEIFESALKRTESSVHELEEMVVENTASLCEAEKKQIEGVTAGILQSARNVLMNLNLSSDPEAPDVKWGYDEDDIERIVLSMFVEAGPLVGQFQHRCKWYAPLWGVDTLSMLIEKIQEHIVLKSRCK